MRRLLHSEIVLLHIISPQSQKVKQWNWCRCLNTSLADAPQYLGLISTVERANPTFLGFNILSLLFMFSSKLAKSLKRRSLIDHLQYRKFSSAENIFNVKYYLPIVFIGLCVCAVGYLEMWAVYMVSLILFPIFIQLI